MRTIMLLKYFDNTVAGIFFYQRTDKLKNLNNIACPEMPKIFNLKYLRRIPKLKVFKKWVGSNGRSPVFISHQSKFKFCTSKRPERIWSSTKKKKNITDIKNDRTFHRIWLIRLAAPHFIHPLLELNKQRKIQAIKREAQITGRNVGPGIFWQ